ncbi:MAG: hypothetical protein U1E48_00900 [Paracoccaceae bacterium]
MVDNRAQKSTDQFRAFRTYWKAYGGVAALLGSPYLFISLVFTLGLNPLWLLDGKSVSPRWVEIALAVLPSMVSFSLGAVAIIMALSSGVFLRIIQSNGAPDSYFMKAVSAFFHFILTQFLGIFVALVSLAYHVQLISYLGCWIFLYALLCGVAAAAAMMNMAELRNKASALEDKK